MRIEKKEAFYVARYLHKGIIVNNYRDICVPIGAGTEIGATKRGRNCNVYIKYNDRIVKEKRPRMFHPNIEMGELAEIVKEEINNCQTIESVELDMNKIPVVQLDEEVVAEPDENGTIDDYEEYVPVDDGEDNMITDSFYDTQESDDIGDSECEEMEEKPDNCCDDEDNNLDDITVDELGDPGTDELYNRKVIGHEAELTDIAPEVTFDEVEDCDDGDEFDFQDDVTTSDKKNAGRKVGVAGVARVSEIDSNKVAFLRQDKRIKEERNYKMDKLELSDKNFIVKEFEENETAVKENMAAMIDKVIEVNPRLAMQFYEDGILSLLKYYDNDIEKMTDETGMDCKAIYRIVVNLLLHKRA